MVRIALKNDMTLITVILLKIQYYILDIKIARHIIVFTKILLGVLCNELLEEKKGKVVAILSRYLRRFSELCSRIEPLTCFNC